eukprot:g5676.t1
MFTLARIPKSHFANASRVLSTTTAAPVEAKKIVRELSRTSNSINELFVKLDKDQDGQLSKEDFDSAFRQIGLEELKQLTQSLSRNELSRQPSRTPVVAQLAKESVEEEEKVGVLEMLKNSFYHFFPSCDDDISKYCLSGSDLSPAGIEKCLALQSNLSEDCKTYRTLLESCATEVAKEGPCGNDHLNGDAMPCLLQRAKPSDLSEDCARVVSASQPKKDTSLRATFWSDGKRKLSDEERDSLNDVDLNVYDKWWARKQKKNSKNSDVQYAIRQQKKEKYRKIAVHRAMGEARKVLDSDGTKKAAKKAAYKSIKRSTKKVITFDKDEMKAMANDAVKAAQREIKQDELNKQKEL